MLIQTLPHATHLQAHFAFLTTQKAIQKSKKSLQATHSAVVNLTFTPSVSGFDSMPKSENERPTSKEKAHLLTAVCRNCRFIGSFILLLPINLLI